ncbi:MAG TPA: SGNH/GDSL hydrolase family protein [Oculatellaceae cyanobacterium]
MKTILCFGDSNTWGYDDQAKKDDLPGRFDINTRWTGLLAQSLGSGYRIIEEGLNGRTTAFEDPLWDYRAGKHYLVPCLDSHRPLDLVSIMLGTNDLKLRFAASPVDITQGLDLLIEKVNQSRAGIDGGIPKLLLVAPPPIGTFSPCDEPSWTGAQARAAELPRLYEELAKKRNVHFANSQSVIKIEDLAQDGLHLSANAHAKLAKFMLEKIKEIV